MERGGKDGVREREREGEKGVREREGEKSKEGQGLGE